jgi:hypothetical protein
MSVFCVLNREKNFIFVVINVSTTNTNIEKVYKLDRYEAKLNLPDKFQYQISLKSFNVFLR